MGCQQSGMMKNEITSGVLRQENEDAKSQLIMMKSVIAIQKWYRGYQARLEARRKCSWMIYQSIEYSGEQDQLKLHNFFLDLLNLMGQQNLNSDSLFTKALSKSTSINGSNEYENDIPLETDYSGPIIQFPLTLKVITSLINAFSNEQILHGHYLFELLVQTKNVLKSKPNISHTDLSIFKQITICGDLHGQLQDLIHIFEKNRYPDPSNPYVFNGDFVDRGKHSVEVAVILFSFLILYPGCVFLNRGNHEDKIMNLRYGFIKEVQVKYKTHANVIINLFADIFRWLPLATIISNKIFICHGGISNRVQLEILKNIDRSKYISPLNCPSDSQQDQNEWLQVLDILWSDPKPQKGCRQNLFRGGGCYFGPDITHQFLTKNHFHLLIRSHECKPLGYEWCHKDEVLTIFSASNYYDTGSNKGAFIKLTKTLEPKITCFNASKEFQKKILINEESHAIEDSAMRELRKKILTNRSQLMSEFLACDGDSSGLIESHYWCNIMNAVLQLDLPWRTLRNQLAVVTDSGTVDYKSTFELLTRMDMKEHKTSKFAVTDELYKYRDTLETVFRILDSDNSGRISIEEFKEGCKILKKHSNTNMTSEAMEDLAKSIDINKDGSIDLNEFLEAFRINEDNYK